MIDKKTDGTRGSPDSELNVFGGCDKEDEVEREETLNMVDNINGLTITPLTNSAFQELARLGGHAEKLFFKPIVQVVHLKKKSASELYDVKLSDGVSYISGTPCSGGE